MSLRTRLVLSHTLIVVLCLGIAGVATLLLLQDYRDRYAYARLDDMTIPIYVQTKSLAQGETSLEEVWGNLKKQAQESGVHVLLVDDEGSIVRQVSPEEAFWSQRVKLPSGGLPSDISEPYHGTYVMPKGQTFVFAAYPLAGLFGSRSSSVPEVLVLAVPRQSALALFSELVHPFLWAALIALVVSAVIAILFARSVYRPLQRVTRAAEEVSRGEYERELPVAGPTEVKALASGFNLMAKQVTQSQQRLRDFVIDVSHELRSPLTSIRGFAQAMCDGTARNGQAQSRAAEIIEDEAKRMMRQVDELLELSRIESGQMEMLCQPVDTKELLQHCLEVFAVRADEKGLHLRAEIEAVPLVVGDIDHLEQVFSNLLDNAVKHTPPGGQVSIVVRGPCNDFVEVVVADTGPGISPEELPRVFERFHRADPDRSGTGLGLAIARGIVRAHGGDIEVRSAPGAGAEFIVRLPTNLSFS
jgi:signal transduction histidine kinase